MRGMGVFFCVVVCGQEVGVGKYWLYKLLRGGRLRAWRLPRGRNSVQKDIFRELSSMEETWSIIC